MSTAAKLSPVFGPERNTYLRMIYGTTNDHFAGITPGRFYDMRGLPVPFKPFDVTWFKLDINDESVDGKTIVVSNTHPESIDGGSSDRVNIILSYPTTVFGIRLAHGLNWIQAISDGVTIADSTVTSTHYASLLYQSALQIYSGVWRRLETLSNDVFSGDGTRVTAPLIKNDDHFSHSAALNKASRSIVVNALMNFPSSGRTAQAFSQAVLGSTALITDVSSRWLDKSWLGGGMPSNADAYPAGKVVTIWAPDEVSGHFATAPWLASASGIDFTCGRASLSIEGLHHDMKSLDKPVEFSYPRSSTWLELADSEDTLDIDVWVMNRQWGRVQRPGLWDYPGSYFDTGNPLDSNRQFDASTKSIDIAMTGFVGMKLVKRKLIDHTGEAAVGVIEASAASMYMDSSTVMYKASWSEELVWGFTTAGSLTDSAIFNSSTTMIIDVTPAAVAQKASTAFGATLVLGDVGSGHSHLTSTLTKGQIATAKSGVPVTVTSQFPADQSTDKHQHTLIVSWYDGWTVEVQANHAHDATINEAT